MKTLNWIKSPWCKHEWPIKFPWPSDWYLTDKERYNNLQCIHCSVKLSTSNKIFDIKWRILHPIDIRWWIRKNIYKEYIEPNLYRYVLTYPKKYKGRRVDQLPPKERCLSCHNGPLSNKAGSKNQVCYVCQEGLRGEVIPKPTFKEQFGRYLTYYITRYAIWLLPYLRDECRGTRNGKKLDV